MSTLDGFVDVDGVAAPPRRNGELAFDAPWQGRVFALTGAVVERCFDGDREPFRQRLIAAIAECPERPYWDSWTVAFERLVVETDIVSADEVSSLPPLL